MCPVRPLRLLRAIVASVHNPRAVGHRLPLSTIRGQYILKRGTMSVVIMVYHFAPQDVHYPPLSIIGLPPLAKALFNGVYFKERALILICIPCIYSAVTQLFINFSTITTFIVINRATYVNWIKPLTYDMWLQALGVWLCCVGKNGFSESHLSPRSN